MFRLSILTGVSLCSADAPASAESILQAIACNDRIDEGWSLRRREGLFEGKIKVYVQNIKQLDMIIHRINRIKGVIKASWVATSE